MLFFRDNIFRSVKLDIYVRKKISSVIARFQIVLLRTKRCEMYCLMSQIWLKLSMDVDNELEGKLLQQFSSMGTTDKEVLISEFQKLLEPNQLNPAGCAFFLDMNNW